MNATTEIDGNKLKLRNSLNLMITSLGNFYKFPFISMSFILVSVSLSFYQLFILSSAFGQEEIAKGKRRVALFPFEINSPEKRDEFLSAAFPDTLTSALAQVRALILTERGELKRILEEQKLGQSGVVDPETAVKAGKILGIQTAVLGSFNRIGTKVRATCRLVDIATGEVQKMHIVKVDKTLFKEEELFDLMDEVANSLIKTFDVRVTQAEIKQMASRTEPTQNISAYEFYTKGKENMLLFDPEGYEKAVSYLKKAIELDPKYALAYAALAETYFYWGYQQENNGEDSQFYYDLTYENAKKAIQLRPDLSESHRAMSWAHSVGKRTDNEFRKKEAQKAVDLNPNDAESYFSLWYANGAREDDPLIQKALALNPRLVAAYVGIGTMLMEKGQYDEAIPYYKKAAEINPRYSMAYYNLGVAFQSKGLYQDAAYYSKKAIEINPRYSRAYYNLGLALLYQNLYDDAIFYTKKAIEIDPRYSDSYANLCLLYYNQAHYDSAISQCRKALELNPKNPSAHTTLGSAFYMKGDLRTAREEWREGCDLGNEIGCNNLKQYTQ